jgi:5-methyltetrahydropteroyltriglutamate--homocysteine methyltransferase
MTAASPGLIASVFGDAYYADHESYLGAITAAMAPEYRAIVDAGITLQLDCPDLAGSYSWTHKTKSVEQFRGEVARSLEALDTATAGLAPELLRLHVCWGNTESPHVHDLALVDIVDLLLGARPAGLSFEAANPRHAHEWRIFEEIAVPDDKYLIPGVIDSTTNFVEHPDLIAQRLENFGRLVGSNRVVAGIDCGFATFAGPRRVAESVTWAKLESLVAGAAAATNALRGGTRTATRPS